MFVKRRIHKPLLTTMLTLLVSISLFSGCTSSDSTDTTASGEETETEGIANTADVATVDTKSVGTYFDISVDYDDEDLDDSWDSADATTITLDGDAVSVSGDGASADDTVVTISAAGTYVVSGTLSDGQIIVDADSEDLVHLVLSGADITCADSAPIYIKSADKIVLTLEDGTSNSVADGGDYDVDEDKEPSATVFSKDDLTINGGGSLKVSANYQAGIQCKDDLKITGGIITVDAAGDGIKGKDSVAICGGTITILAGADGIETSNDTDDDKGYVAIDGGTLDITAELDGIQAQTNIKISSGDITICSGGGSGTTSADDKWGNWNNDDNSAKGIKATVDLTITGGTVFIDSSDDAIHTNNSVTILDGTIAISSGDDGIHADEALSVSDGDITITQSYEGLESAGITISGGMIDITASDDGINVAGGNDGSAMNQRPGQNNFSTDGSMTLNISGGYIYMNAGGDGLDSNGSFYMTGGTAIVNGPTDNGNGALDAGQTQIDGGYLIAVGSSGMLESPDTSSTQYSLVAAFDSYQSAGTLIHIETDDGEDILTFAPAKEYSSIVFCSPDLQSGKSYVLSLGGSCSGDATDGVYSGGSYSGGSEAYTFTISSSVTTAGTSGGMTGGGGHGGGPGR